jgi:hypothetical protein
LQTPARGTEISLMAVSNGITVEVRKIQNIETKGIKRSVANAEATRCETTHFGGANSKSRSGEKDWNFKRRCSILSQRYL